MRAFRIYPLNNFQLYYIAALTVVMLFLMSPVLIYLTTVVLPLTNLTHSTTPPPLPLVTTVNLFGVSLLTWEFLFYILDVLQSIALLFAAELSCLWPTDSLQLASVFFWQDLAVAASLLSDTRCPRIIFSAAGPADLV